MGAEPARKTWRAGGDALEDADVYRHADGLAEREQRPVIAFCGLDDRLLEPNRRFHEHLQRLDIEHWYAEFDGGHDCAYQQPALPLVSWSATEIAALVRVEGDETTLAAA